MKNARIAMLAVTALVGGLLLTGCSSANSSDAANTDTQLSKYQNGGQGIPQYDHSGSRDTMLKVLDAKVKGTPAVAYFFARGGSFNNPIFTCNGKGYGLPATTQLTNPWQVAGTSGVAIGMMEPDGTYTGQSDGTFFRCVDTTGTERIPLSEVDGFFLPGASHWDFDKHTIVMDK
jgi:hypothetical protein